MEEQRIHKRAKVDIRVAYKDNGLAYRMGRVSNISKGGMFIITGVPPDDIDGYIVASLDAEEFGKIIWTQGQVIRKTNTGIAVAFTRIDEKGLDILLSHRGIPV